MDIRHLGFLNQHPILEEKDIPPYPFPETLDQVGACEAPGADTCASLHVSFPENLGCLAEHSKSNKS